MIAITVGQGSVGMKRSGGIMATRPHPPPSAPQAPDGTTGASLKSPRPAAWDWLQEQHTQTLLACLTALDPVSASRCASHGKNYPPGR